MSIFTRKKCLHENVVLYGLDADLIMLGLIHSRYCKSIYLYRETSRIY